MTYPQPRSGISSIRPYIQGQRAETGGRSIKLSANESALGPSPKAVTAYHAAAEKMPWYPDMSAVPLREAIAGHYGLDPARILLGIGSDELLAVLVRAYAGADDEVIFPTVTFPMYRIYTLSAGAAVMYAADKNYTADVDAILAAVTNRTKIVIIANPNNPTGTYLAKPEMERLRAGLRDEILLVIDAAYAEYVEQADYDDGAAMAHSSGNTVMTRTFSKIHGLAGLRLGWCYASAEIISVAGRIRSPFNISTAAQAAGLAAIEDTEHQTAVATHTRKWREIAIQRLKGLGLPLTGAEGNFVTCEFPDMNGRRAEDAHKFLAARGISVRPMAAFGLPRHLRITIGRDRDMEACLGAVEDFISNRK